MTSVTWTKNGDNKYLVESTEHLLQIMNQGSLYTNAGTVPTNYWASSYLQTVDIDLVNDHANITPIGISGDSFTGEYDGNQFQISNWSYSGSGGENYTGLFGHCHPATLKHIRLSGVWTLSAGSYGTGFLAGYMFNTTAYDVEGNFDAGTTISGVSNNTGGLFGDVSTNCSCTTITLRGTLEFEHDVATSLGGVFGSLEYATLEQCRNLASFPGGIRGVENVGGLVGSSVAPNVFSKCLNAMQGDITGLHVGGIAGRLYHGRHAYGTIVNSMAGNITSTGTAGGMFGYMTVGSNNLCDCTKLLNYMKGDVVGSTGSGGITASIEYSTSGDASQYGDINITKSVVAMQGAVGHSVRASEHFTPSAMEVTVDSTFGMHFDQNEYGQATMVVDDALVYHPGFTDLPYFVLEGVDPSGTTYDWDFVYANLGGKYEEYTHLSVHTSPSISAPLPTTVGSLAADTAYLAYAHVTEKSMYIDSTLNIVQTEAAVVFDLAKSTVVYGTPTPATTLVWTKDADGKFEIQSKQHLLQLMHKGALYTDLGERPTNALSYWTHHYVQTAEIDFAGHDLATVVHIGDETTTFLGSYEENGFEVLNWRDANTGDDESLFGSYTTLEWATNAEGQCEVPTADHLVQIMQRGLLFHDDGDFPADHWSASYVQTADIDLAECHAKILPIGDATTSFTGQYDGAHFKISNWSYTQPTDSASVTTTGLFGIVTNAEVKHLRLDGVWTLNGSDHASTYLADGFLCGTAVGSTVYGIEGDFAAGTLLAGGSSTTAPITHRVGCLMGYTSQSVICNVTLKGIVDLKDFGADGHNTFVGGVIGYVINSASSVSLCRNVAKFPNGITGNTAGGLVGYFHQGSMSTCINAMQGDVIGITYAGGVCGLHVPYGLCEIVVNSMTGNVDGTENSGGIHGCVDASNTNTQPSSQLMNYMKGNVEGTNSGGVVGLVKRSTETGDFGITNSIVAMHGAVDQHVSGSLQYEPSAMDVVVNTDFGMNGDSDASTTLTGFTTNVEFTDLPHIPLVEADPDGFIQTFDFVFANLGGHKVYENVYTHLSLHTAQVSAPIPTDYGLLSTNAQVYLTYANVDTSSIFVDDALTIVETEADVAYNHDKTAVLLGSATLPLICEPRALTIQAITNLSLGQTAHLTHQATSANAREIVADAEFLAGSSITKIIQDLVPDTMYMIRLYADDALVEKVLVTTATNSAENYDVNDFYNTEEELYDISKIGDSVSGAIVNEIFTTGDFVEVDMAFARKTTMETTFVKKGELVEIDQVEALLLPFDPSTTETQESTMKLSDNTSVTVSLAQGSSSVTIGGTTYPSGKSFVLDGKKVTAWDI